MQTSVRRQLGLLSLIALLAMLLAACGSAPAAAPGTAPAADTPAAAAPTAAPAAAPVSTVAPAPAAEPLKVVATYSILGDFVQNVAGDLVELTTLVGPGGDPHVYEPTPRDSAALAEANILFENGLMFESWIDDLVAASGTQANRVAVSAKITPLAAAEEGPEHAEGEEHGHSHGEYDPHIWHDPNNAMLMVEAIRDALAAADPANAATYAANADAYLAELKDLDAFVSEQVASLPTERRKLVTTHDTFGYFAARYGFEIVGTALGVTTEAADPAAGEIGELVEQIRAAGVPAIFAENIANPSLMETIAREAGVTLAPTLYTDALGEPGSAGTTYLELVRYNVTTIVTALAG